jgi:beta-barrel assembly-enhancing protease
MNRKTVILTALILFFIVAIPRLIHAEFTLEDEKKLGNEIYAKLNQGDALLKNERVLDYIQQIGKRILDNSDKVPFDFRFSVIRSSAINAFATPGGYVYLNRGLINLVESESELASVMAHEIAHVNARHIADTIEKSKKVNIATLAGILAGVLLGGGGNLTAGLIGMSTAAGATLSLRYSREHEEEADRLGMMYLVKSGYEPRSMIDFMKIMRRYEYYSSNIPSYFLTHPGTDERIRYLDASVQTTYTNHGQKAIVGNFKRIQTILLLIGSSNMKSNHNHFEEGLKKNPNDVDDLYGLAVTKEKMGQTAEALQYFHKALSLAPGDPDILSDTGVTYFRAGQIEEAIKYLNSATMYGGNDPETILYLGKAYEAKGDLPSAFATIKKLDGMKIDDEDIYYNLAMLHGKANHPFESHLNFGMFFKKKKKYESALFHFKAALQNAAPGNPKAAYIDQEIKDLQKRQLQPPDERKKRPR